MLTRHTAGLLRVCTLLALVLPMVPGDVAAAPPRQGPSSPLTVYHELTQRPDGSRPIEALVLSGDGRRAIWAESSRDPTQSNQVFALDIDGGQPREIDAYTPICRCRTQVDVSNDGNTVVSTEGVRIRVLAGVDTGGAPREVLRLSNDVIGPLRISGDGRIIVFTVSRDTTISEPNPRNHGAPIPRGVWAISASGGELVQLAGIREIAAVSGVPVAELAAAHEFHRRSWENALDVSDDGRRIIFGASVGSAADAGYSITEGAPLTQLIGPVEDVYQVAVSGDGQTVAFATEEQGRPNLTVVTGSTKTSLLSSKALRIYDRLQLSRDGTQLLTIGRCCNVLIELATMATRELIPQVPLNREGDSSLFMGYFRFRFQVTMNAAGTRILYVTNRYAANRGNLAVIELGATDSSGAPLVRGLTLDPDTIPRDGSKSASVSTEISWDGILVGVWLEIFRDGVRDATFGDSGVRPMQNTVGPDPGRLRGIFVADLVSRDKEAAPGPRHLRLIIESQAEDGRHYGTVFDADKTLTVGDIGLGSHYQGELAVGDAQVAGRLFPPGDFRELRDVRATIQLDPATNTVLGGSLSYEAFLNDPSPLRRDVFSSARVQGSATVDVLPAGILGEAIFYGELTSYDGNGNVRPGYESYQVFFYASDPAGQLVLCGYDVTIWDLEQAELQHQWCLANPFIVLRPVQGVPPVAVEVPT